MFLPPKSLCFCCTLVCDVTEHFLFPGNTEECLPLVCNLPPPKRGQSDQDLGRAAFGIGSPFPMNSQNTVACGSSSRESRPVEDDVRGNTGSLESPVEV